jgi:hypothetical protein
MADWPLATAAARSDEKIDDMVTRGVPERRERRTERGGWDYDGAELAAGLLSGIQHTAQIRRAEGQINKLKA